MARSGVGEISLFDMDDVCVSNSNRQLHALSSTVGQSKVEVMAERIRAINPDCIVHAVADFVTRDTMAECITPDMDFVIDCIDSVNAKAALISGASGARFRWSPPAGRGQIDPTLIQIADLNRTFNDPLASKVRSTLRRDYGFSRTPNRHYSVPCVFSTEQLRYPKPDGSICLEKKFVGEGVKLDCAGGFGAVMMVTATFGMVAATRAVDKLVAGTRRPSERIKPALVTPDQA